MELHLPESSYAAFPRDHIHEDHRRHRAVDGSLDCSEASVVRRPGFSPTKPMLHIDVDDETFVSNVTDLQTVYYQTVRYPTVDSLPEDHTLEDPFQHRGAIEDGPSSVSMTDSERRLVSTKRTAHRPATVIVDSQIEQEAKGLTSGGLGPSLPSKDNDCIRDDDRVKREALELASVVRKQRFTCTSEAGEVRDKQIKEEARNLALAIGEQRRNGSPGCEQNSTYSRLKASGLEAAVRGQVQGRKSDQPILKEEARSPGSPFCEKRITVPMATSDDDSQIKQEATNLAIEAERRRSMVRTAEVSNIRTTAGNANTVVLLGDSATSQLELTNTALALEVSMAAGPGAVGVSSSHTREIQSCQSQTRLYVDDSDKECDVDGSIITAEASWAQKEDEANCSLSTLTSSRPRYQLELKVATCVIISLVTCAVIIGGICGSAKCSSNKRVNSKDQEPSPMYLQHQGAIMASLGGKYFESEHVARKQALDWLLYQDSTRLQDNNFLQRFVLAVFYFQTSETNPWQICSSEGEEQDSTCGDNEERWLSQTHECYWGGVSCNDATMRVNGLTLSNYGLNGPLPTELASLRDLSQLSLTQNELDGTIGHEFGLLSNLEVLDLSNNQLHGVIPDELVAFAGHYFDISFNYLTGSLSSGICDVVEKHDGGTSNSTTAVLVKADCYSSTGFPEVTCPEGCCTECCSVYSKRCFPYPF